MRYVNRAFAIIALSAGSLAGNAEAEVIADPINPLTYTEAQYAELVDQVERFCSIFPADYKQDCIKTQFDAFGDLMLLGREKPDAVQRVMKVNLGDYAEAFKAAERWSLRGNVSIFNRPIVTEKDTGP